MRRKKVSATLSALLAIGIAYGAVAYFALPEFWTVHDRHLADRIGNFLTTTPQGIPGDPINVGLVGTKEEVLRAFAKAGWSAADPITWRSSIDIGLSVALDRPDADAPVSTLLYEGRRQDLAFEKLAGTSADRRHHVRFWKTAELDTDGRPLWLGSASFDRGVGFSHDTGQITHHIAPDVDAERDNVIASLQAVHAISSVDEAMGVGKTTNGRNGGGDPYFTDGIVKIGVLVPEDATAAS
jgi:hypothetical protein